MTWTDATPEALNIALSHARGSYQRGLLAGHESLSGSTLRGRAKSYGSHYAASRGNLLSRLAADPRLEVREERRDHGRRVLVLRLRSQHDDCAVTPGMQVLCGCES